MELTYEMPRFAIGAPPPPTSSQRAHPMHEQFLLRCLENPTTWVSLEVPTEKRAAACYTFLRSKGLEAATRRRNGTIRVYARKEQP